MKRGIIKATALIALTSIALTSFDINTVRASSSTVVSAGGALAAGNGSSIQDIRAKIARNAAKKTAANNHSKITSADDLSLESGETASDDNDITLVQMDDASGTADKDSVGASGVRTISAPEPVDESTIQKVETPSSKAVTEGMTVNGISVVGSASEAATIEVTSTDENVSDESGSDEAAADDADAAGDGTEADGDTENGTEDADGTSDSDGTDEATNPTIDIKPAAADVEDGEEDLSDRVIADCDGYVNVRDIPSEDGEVVGKLYNHSAGIWLGKEGDWYKIESGSVTGYVKGEYVKTGQAAIKLAAEVGQRMAVVTTTTLKIREEASTDSAVLGLVAQQDALSVVEENDEWVKVSIEEGDGWVSKEFVSVSTEFPKAESKAEEEARLKKEEEERKKANAAAAKATKGSSSKPSSGGGSSISIGGSGMGVAVANYGLQFVGNPYVYGGTSLTNGTDCSGFTMGVYKNFGVSLPHSSGAQRSCGYAVSSIAEAQPGDLICYSGHVAIYIGNGQIVHASTAATGIKVSNVSYRSILAIRRIF